VSDACAACATPLPARGAKCGRCGRVDLERAREINRAGAETVRRAVEGSRAARVLLYGSLLAVVAVVAVEASLPEGGAWRAAAENGLFALVAVAGLRALGPGAGAGVLGGPARAAHLLPAVATGLVAGALWAGWDLLVSRALSAPAPAGARLDAALFVAGILVPVLAQEALTRGATREALSRFATPRKTGLVVAAQFALLEVAWSPLSVPARFGAGLLLGILRERTGSLAPCLAAHAVARSLVLALPL
jgi:membrane protease YdiL (CAAX protease family)